MTKVPAIITENAITVTTPNYEAKTIPASHPNFARAKELLMNGATWAALEPLLDLPRAVVNFMGGRVQVTNGVLTLDGRPIHNGLSRKILEFINAKQEGLAEPLVALLDNVLKNPSMRAVEGLYDWLERSNLPITPDGHILAWKIVGPDYKDLRTRKFDNSIGKIVEQPRNACDENPDQTCSAGLHFCSSGYLPHYGNSSGNRIVVVKVHPKDVVAFPRDYNTAKGRCCRYEVVGEVERERAVDEYFGGSKVFGGFEKVQETAPSIFPLTVGQVVRLRNGDTAVVTKIGNLSIADLRNNNGQRHVVFSTTGRANHVGGNDRPFDVVAGLFPLQEGDKVQLRDGRIATVEKAGATARLSEGHYVYSDTGRGDAGKEQPYDVVGFAPAEFTVVNGGRYNTRKGGVVTITGRNSHSVYTLKGSNGLVYTAKGQFLEGVETDNDLVSVA